MAGIRDCVRTKLEDGRILHLQTESKLIFITNAIDSMVIGGVDFAIHFGAFVEKCGGGKKGKC